MVIRTAVLCAIEAVLVTLLALQVFAEPKAPVPHPEAPPTHDAAHPRPAPALTAPGPTPAPTSPAAASDPAPVPRDEVAAKWNPADPIGVLLTGAVRHRDGRPADATIRAARDKKTVGAVVEAGGCYAMLGLAPGEWTITLGGTGVVETSSTLVVTDEAVQRADFVVDAAFPVRVLIVTPAGTDATMALRTAMPGFGDFSVAGQRDRFPDQLAPTDYGRVFVGDAKWSSEMNPKDGFAGTLHLAALPAHVALLQRHLVLEQQVVQPDQKEVKFTVDVEALQKLAASAIVRVLDAGTGEPLAKARVSLDTSNRGGRGQPVDAEGRAVLAGLSPGLLRCQIDAPEYETMYTTVRLDSGQRLDLGDVRLGPMVKLTGTVLDADGKPATASLTWAELKWRLTPAAFATNRSARTEADGTFTLWGTGRGTIAIAAADQAGNVARGVFDNPPATPIVLRLAKPCELQVTRPNDPTRAFTVTLFDAARRAIAGFPVEPRRTGTPLRMPAGDYTFEVHDEQFRLVQSGSLTFGATPCSLEIR